MTEKRYRMINTNLADENGRIYYNIQRNDGVNICQVYGKNNAKSLINELNELNDEIEFFKFALDSNREVTMEVEQEQCRLYKKLEKENKELKDKLENGICPLCGARVNKCGGLQKYKGDLNDRE